MSTFISFWLIPVAEDLTLFQTMINSLAKANNAPVFTPHVTLYAGECTDLDDPAAMIDRATQGVSPMSLDINGMRYTEAFTKTLFVQFHSSQAVSDLSSALRATAARPSDYVLDPHLSLMYKHMPDASKKVIASALKFPRAHVRFDSVWASLAPDHTRSAEDVAKWVIVYRKSLSATRVTKDLK